MNQGINPLQLIQLLRNSRNPEEVAYNLIQQNMGDNPFFMNLFQLGSQNKTKEIEEIARKAFKEQGRDFDKEFQSFRQRLGL